MNNNINYMISMYGEYCWMNGIITKKNKLTIHHIIPIRDRRISKYSNYALLTSDMHLLYNHIEKYYEEEALLLTELFLKLNSSFSPPNEEYKRNIDLILSKIKI